MALCVIWTVALSVLYISDRMRAQSSSSAHVSFTSDFLVEREQALLLDRVKRLELELEMSQLDRNYLVIDRHLPHFWVRRGKMVLYEGSCGVGRGRTIINGKRFDFETPSGLFSVKRKLAQPWWTRPNWFWTEQGLAVPRDIVKIPQHLGFEGAMRYYNSLSRDDKLRVRAVPGTLGRYVIHIADGIYIHYGDVTGGQVSHGCIRVSHKDAEAMYNLLQLGDPVYIY